MTDLHALLKQSIIDRGIDDPRDRDEIYAEARRAVIRRLWEHEPPLDEASIDTRISAFDRAVADIEDELHYHFDRGAHRRLPPPPAEPAPDDERDEAAIAPAAAVPVRARYADEPAMAGEDDPYYPDPVDADPYGADEAAAVDPPAGSGPAAYEPDPYESDPYAADPYAADPGTAGTYSDDAYAPPRDELAPYDSEAPDPYAIPLGYAGDPEDDPESAADAYDEEADAYSAPPQGDRWTAPPPETPVRPREPLTRPRPAKRREGVSERTKVGLLVGAIALLLLVLGGIGVSVLLPQPEEEGVVVAIEDRRQVSDAATAARIAAEDLPIRQTFRLFDGLDPTVFETAADNPVRFDSDGEGSFARVSSSSSAAGARLVIGPGLAGRLAGERVRVRMIVRSSTDRGALSMRFAYQSGIAISHWQTANLNAGYEEVAILWRVPSQRTSVAGDYVVIEPGIPGDGTGVDVRSAELDIIAE